MIWIVSPTLTRAGSWALVHDVAVMVAGGPVDVDDLGLESDAADAWRAPLLAVADEMRTSTPPSRGPVAPSAGDEHGDPILDAGLLALRRIGANDAALGDVVALFDHRVDHPEPRRFECLPSLFARSSRRRRGSRRCRRSG